MFGSIDLLAEETPAYPEKTIFPIRSFAWTVSAVAPLPRARLAMKLAWMSELLIRSTAAPYVGAPRTRKASPFVVITDARLP